MPTGTVKKGNRQFRGPKSKLHLVSLPPLWRTNIPAFN